MIPFIILYCNAERENELFFVISQAREEELNSKFRREFDEFYSCVSKQLWSVLFNKYKRFIPPYSKNDIDDAYQEGWYNIVKKRNTFKKEKSSKVFNWLSTVMINSGYNYFEKNKNENGNESINTKKNKLAIQRIKDGTTLENQLMIRETVDELNRIVFQNLTDIEKLVYKMRIIDEMIYQDIADELGIALGTVHNHFNNGINKIRKHFKFLNR